MSDREDTPKTCPSCNRSFVTETLSSWICTDCGATKEKQVSKKARKINRSNWNMFYQYVHGKWKSGKVRVGLSAGRDKRVYLEAPSIVGLALLFLSKKETGKLEEWSKAEAREAAEVELSN